MPTIKKRYRCVNCRGRFIRSKMSPVIVGGYYNRDIKWECFKCPVKNGHKKIKNKSV